MERKVFLMRYACEFRGKDPSKTENFWSKERVNALRLNKVGAKVQENLVSGKVFLFFQNT